VCLAQQGERVRRVLIARACQQRPRLCHVQLAGSEVEPVAVVPRLQPGRRRSEVRAQPGDMGVQGLTPRLGDLGRPQRVQEVIDRDDPAPGEREQRQHSAPLGAGHVDRCAVDDQPQRPEHLHPHRAGHVSAHRGKLARAAVSVGGLSRLSARRKRV
jgi:hypothetical protein